MLDFTKLGTGNTVDTLLKPRELFNALPNKNTQKFQYPRDVQSKVWESWFQRRNEPDLLIKMNTGSGKTVVALLILKSSLNEGKGPVVYICPDGYLVEQVCNTATELGIEVTQDVNSHRFQSGNSILVINIHKLVNGRSVFGVSDQGAKINFSTMIIDDAHACMDSIEDQFTLKIPSDSNLYSEIYGLFKTTLNDQCYSKALDIELGDKDCIMNVPYWVWQERKDDILRLLHSNKNEEFLIFTYPLLKECIELCHCVISSSGIEISPFSIPINVFPSISSCERKIYMTANLVDDSILVSHFSVNEESIRTPIVPDSAGDIGDRMILFPQIINPMTTDDEIKALVIHAASTMNVVVIVPSNYRANYWEDVAAEVAEKESIYETIERLKNSHVGLVVFVNRYDGIDLPGDACRLLIIDGVPDVRRGMDKINQSLLSGTDRQSNQLVQRVEQGIGRGVRSNDDHCVVLLMGRGLSNKFFSPETKNKLSPGTLEQVKLSEQLSQQVLGRPINELWDVMCYCWFRDQQWVTASKGVLASLKYSLESNLNPIPLSVRKAFNNAQIRNIHQSLKDINIGIEQLTENKGKGYLKQFLGAFININDPLEAQRVQVSAISDNSRVFKPISGFNYVRNIDKFKQATKCLEFMQREDDLNKLLIDFNSLKEDLIFKENTSDRFEEAIRSVAKYIGFEAQRPENDFKSGPDDLWNTGGLNYFVIEAKNGSTTRRISKHDCNQLGGSCTWFETNYSNDCTYTPIMIHCSYEFEHACSPNTKIRIMTPDKLQSFCDAIDSFLKSVTYAGASLTSEFIYDRLMHNKLRDSDIVKSYTTSFSVSRGK
jgi:hypothetical protein